MTESPQSRLQATIEDRSSTRDDVARVYAEAINSPEVLDWGTINRAIVARWSRSALVYAKEQAWKGHEVDHAG